jgi:hypothetical protein
MDALKILISLFTPEVARPLAANGTEQRGRVFFFAFDQMEGRKELFDREDDWFKFFAQLSELYNALPNVFVLFTMTDRLRNELYPRMERQFQQRIHRDHRFLLQRLSDDDLLSAYRHRIDCWLGDKLPEVRNQLNSPLYRYLPFSREEVLAMRRSSGEETLREMLEKFDGHFRQFMEELVTTDARLDFLVARNELHASAEGTNPFGYTETHLVSVRELFNQSGNLLAELLDLSYGGVEETRTPDGLPALRLEFRSSHNDRKWVRVFLARLPYFYSAQLEGCRQLLHHKDTGRYFLWLVRPARIEPSWEDLRSGQVFARELLVETEVTLRAILSLLHKRDKYPEQEWAKAQTLLAEEIKQTYLIDMLTHVASVLRDLSGTEVDGVETPGLASTSATLP